MRKSPPLRERGDHASQALDDQERAKDDRRRDVQMLRPKIESDADADHRDGKQSDLTARAVRALLSRLDIAA